MNASGSAHPELGNPALKPPLGDFQDRHHGVEVAAASSSALLDLFAREIRGLADSRAFLDTVFYRAAGDAELGRLSLNEPSM